MRKHVLAALCVILLASMVLSSCTSAPAAPQTVVQTVEVEKQVTQQVVVTQEVVKEVVKTVVATPEASSAQTYARNETLYTGGTQWGPPAGYNPFNTGNYIMGSIGLLYETLVIYDPIKDEFKPWLAESTKWTSDKVFEVKLRPGIQWTDGKPLTADDVKFTFELGQKAPVNISTVWKFLDKIDKVDELTLNFTFKDPLYQQWSNLLYNTPILPQHLWANKSVEEITSGANEKPVGTGPYLAESFDQTKVVWLKQDNWWAKSALKLDPAPKRIVDIVNSGSNNTALGMVLQGTFDLNTNFLPGVATLVKGGYGVQTYYPDAPYMLSANTAWVIMNLQKKPMDDAAFRKAMAFAVDTDQIVQIVYGNLVRKADPTGLLPTWEKYIDKDVVKELGFSYDAAKAKKLLADAGYKDVNGDKFVENKDGSKIELTIAVPSGWTDWMESAKVVAKSAQAVGINLQPAYPDYGAYIANRNNGEFTMMIGNDAQIANTPWAYYSWMYQHPLSDIATMQNGNYGRYNNQEAFDLSEQLNKVKIDDLDGMKAVISKMQRIQLTDMPVIPLWYNGMWAQANNSVWTNWPSSADNASHWTPTNWRGYLNMTGILMLCDLKPVQANAQ